MPISDIITALDAEIAALQRARIVLSGLDQPARRPGRPKGTTNKATSFDPAEFSPKRRKMSAAVRARMGAAQRARWAKQKSEEETKHAPSAGAKSTAKVASKRIRGPGKKAAAKTAAKAASKKTSVPAKKTAANSRRTTSAAAISAAAS